MNTQPLQRGSQDPITKRRWALVLMMAGVGLRLAYFFQNPPLWLDEINVTLPALHVPFRAFLSGGFAHSTVPIKPALFNIILKASLTFFGNAEWSARLWPLAAGCVSVPLFYAVASRYLNRAGALLALNFFVFSPSLILFSAEVNTYASDILTALMIYGIFAFLDDHGYRKDPIYLFGWVGMLAPWLSYSALFIWIPAAILAGFRLFIKKDRAGLFRFWVMALWWLGSVLRLVQYYVIPTLGSQSFTGDRIMHFPHVHGIPGLIELAGSLGQVFFSQTLRMMPGPWLAVFALWGGLYVYQKHASKGLLLILPFLLFMAAVGLRMYPSFPRSLLFLAPALYMMLAAGIMAAAEKIRERKALAAVLLTMLVVAYPLWQSLSLLSRPAVKEDNRGAVRTLLSLYEPGDQIVLSEYGLQIYMYYLKYFVGSAGAAAEEPTHNPGILRQTPVWRLGQDVRRDNESAYVPVSFYAAHECFLFERVDESGGLLRFMGPLFLNPDKRTWLVFLHYSKEVEAFATASFSAYGRLTPRYKGRNAVVYEFNPGF
ncbi:MAG: glycosyltransferase family 39 protein [Candidatus Omnitrophica bacterium]|nr:glycosyltransferase family 39 protein [Candidatus Omnitrophota bacterium]